MQRYIRIHPADSVAVALQPLPQGEDVAIDDIRFVLRDDIPVGHKFALRIIGEGEDVIKYGAPIGHALRDIRHGELVDHNNIATNLK